VSLASSIRRGQRAPVREPINRRPKPRARNRQRAKERAVVRELRAEVAPRFSRRVPASAAGHIAQPSTGTSRTPPSRSRSACGPRARRQVRLADSVGGPQAQPGEQLGHQRPPVQRLRGLLHAARVEGACPGDGRQPKRQRDIEVAPTRLGLREGPPYKRFNAVSSSSSNCAARSCHPALSRAGGRYVLMKSVQPTCAAMTREVVRSNLPASPFKALGADV